MTLKVRNIQRDGQTPFGGTFGFSNAVELPVPVDTRTTDFQSALEWTNGKAGWRAGLDCSTFDNDTQTVVWDNPAALRAGHLWWTVTGPDVPLARQHPVLRERDRFGQLPGHGRATGYVAVGAGKSNEPLLPFTINTALAQVPLSTGTPLEAKHQTTIAHSPSRCAQPAWSR